jgi:hypothetical protein
MRVVEPLEMIDVHHHRRELVAVSSRPGDLLLQLGEHGLAGEDARQLVDRGERPGLGEALGQVPEARSETWILDPLGVPEMPRIGRRGEQIEQVGRSPCLTADDREREPSGPDKGAKNAIATAAYVSAISGAMLDRSGMELGISPRYGHRCPVRVG